MREQEEIKAGIPSKVKTLQKVVSLDPIKNSWTGWKCFEGNQFSNVPEDLEGYISSVFTITNEKESTVFVQGCWDPNIQGYYWREDVENLDVIYGEGQNFIVIKNHFNSPDFGLAPLLNDLSTHQEIDQILVNVDMDNIYICIHPNGHSYVEGGPVKSILFEMYHFIIDKLNLHQIEYRIVQGFYLSHNEKESKIGKLQSITRYMLKEVQIKIRSEISISALSEIFDVPQENFYFVEGDKCVNLHIKMVKIVDGFEGMRSLIEHIKLAFTLSNPNFDLKDNEVILELKYGETEPLKMEVM
ncbi:hypothetical protein BK128_04690 [Viridibacillus sp. FSL H7-0596]|uniref:hypothetical protein n=1 Tax=Viridibacillus sp. FSL H7-0596 TaxID=1928923 RepID=UPI00096CAB17|nr:hypothetical protein [Viridibacillus sp. FSL H7-0596]OMC89224.1 hypothetical protein BK128_04690 [Viridibacillus sp. FSL H7-0596]